MQSPLRSVIITVLALIIAVVLLPWIMRGIGYYVDNPGWEVGEIAAERKDPQLCKKIIVFSHIFGPTSAARRGECLYRYASLTQDPSACVLLLPNEYGLACLSTVGGEILDPWPCVKADGTTWVICDGEGSEGYIKVNNPSVDDCGIYQRKDLREWCMTERTTYLPGIHECDGIVFPATKDRCEIRFAFKQKKPELCDLVQQDNRKQYCQILINTWLKYPNLRGSFYFGKPVPMDSALSTTSSS